MRGIKGRKFTQCVFLSENQHGSSGLDLDRRLSVAMPVSSAIRFGHAIRTGLMALTVLTSGRRLSEQVSTSSAASPAPITIAYITDLTGGGAAGNSDSPAGFDARIAMQNAEGGVNGHKLIPLVLDDQTSPTMISTLVQEADSKALGIVSQSPLFFLADKYPQEAGVPVTGSYDDGPEWGTQPFTNMFASDNGSVNPSYPVNTLIGGFLHSHGGTVLGTYANGISPSSSRAAEGAAKAFEHAGGKVGVLNTTVPIGAVNFTADALVAKQEGINAMTPELARRLELCARHRPRAGWREAQGRSVCRWIRAQRDQVAGVEHRPRSVLLVLLPPIRPTECGDGANAIRSRKIRSLQQDPIPELLPIRSVGGG